MYLSISRLALALVIAGVCVGMGHGPARAATASPRAATCTACILEDDAGHVLFARHLHAHLPNASTTKIVTALVVSERADFDDLVVVGPVAAAVGGGGLDLEAGDVYSVEDLLYALLLTSSNDAAVALAEHVAGSEAAFVADMNTLAARLGATDTRFVTAHGLDTPGHYSSAADLALLADALLDVPALARIVATPEAAIVGPAGLELIVNRNVLLESYKGAIGVKTGYTSRAGNVLVAAARRSGRTLIAVAMHSGDAAADARLLLDYGWRRLRHTVLVAADAAVGALVFDGAGSVPAVASEPIRGIASPGRITVSFVPDADARPPVEPGEVVGTVVVSIRGRTLGRVDALAGAPVDDDGGASWLASVLRAVLAAVSSFTERRVAW